MAAEIVAGHGDTRLERVITSGTFSLDGGTWEVDNNVWIVGDESECIVIDAAHDAEPVLDAIGGRTVKAVLCTHAHDDHITAVGDVVEATKATTYLHPDDRMLWDRVYPKAPDQPLADGDTFEVGGVRLEVLHTPGHSPGAVCFRIPKLGVVLTGDTLFNGGPGATGRSFSSYDTITESIRLKLFSLPAETIVLTGHGDSTTIGEEAARQDEWERPDGA